MPQVSVERREAVAIVRFTNPPDGFMDAGTVPELDEVTQALETDEAMRAIVFTGGLPGVFVRHYSVVELDAISERLRGQGFEADLERAAPEQALHRTFRRVREMAKPTIAAINGTAMGGGFEFALHCDFRVAQRGPYSIGLPEINIGILPGAGGTQLLPRLVGTARALELALRGRTVDPEEAAALGLVHEVSDDALATALEWARELAAKPPLAVAHVKELVRLAMERPLQEGMAAERTRFLDVLVTDEAHARMSAMNRSERDIRDC